MKNSACCARYAKVWAAVGLMILALLSARRADAVAVPFSGPIDIENPFTGARSIVLADMDQDGDLDAVAAATSLNEFAWFENLDGLGTSWTKHTIASGLNANGASSVFVADVNGDGFPDVAAAAAAAPAIAWWQNDGTPRDDVGGDGNSWTRRLINSTVNSPSFVTSGDIDGDGDQDVAAVSLLGSAVYWWENIVGNGTSWIQHTVDSSFGSPFIVRLADVNGDGRLDVLAGQDSSNQLAWWQNMGGGATWTKRVITSGLSGARGLDTADIDGDGDLDVFGGAHADSGTVAWYENTNAAGDGTAWTKHSMDTTFLGCSALRAIDLDRDGDVDVVGVSDLGNSVAWWESDGTPRDNVGGGGNSWTKHSIATFTRAFFLDIDDLDGDGDSDIGVAAASASGGAGNRLSWFPNDTIHGSATLPTAHTVDAAFSGAREVNLADINGDGFLDVIGAASTGNAVAWWQNDGTPNDDLGGEGNSWTKRVVDAAFSGATSVVEGDIDRDGDPDLIGAGSTANAIRWWTNTAGDGTAWTSHSVATGISGASSVAVADIDRDGDLDVVGAASGSGIVYWFENTAGTGTSWTAHTVSSTFAGARSVTVADINRDGHPDIAGAAATGNKIVWWQNDGTPRDNVGGDGNSWTTRTVATSFLGASSVTVADMDGDGAPDIVGAAGVGNQVAWWRNVNGAGTSWTARYVSTVFSGARKAVAVDLDHDGDSDIVAAAETSGVVSWFENVNGAGTSWVEYVLDSGFTGASGLAVGDINRNGRPDIVGAAFTLNAVHWWQNRGGQFALATTNISDGSIYENATEGLLKIMATHNGRAGDSDMELATLELLFEQSAGVPLTTSQANNLIANLYVYKDDGNGALDTGVDTLVATVPTLALTAGKQTVIFTPGDVNVQVVQGTPQAYFVAAGLTSNAFGQSPNHFLITHVTEGSSTAEDRAALVPLSLQYVQNVASVDTVAVDATAPQVTSATATASSTVRVVFNEPMTNDAALTTAGNYAFTGGLTAASAVRVSASTVDVTTTTEMVQGQSYTLTVSTTGPTDLVGNFVSPTGNTAVFSGLGQKPQVASANATAATTVRVVFSEAMANAINALDYAFDNGLAASAVSAVNATTVDVTTSAMVAGTAYTLTVSTSGPTDLVGHTVDPAANTAVFVGAGGALPYVVSASATGSTTVRVVFSEAMTNDAALVAAANYTFTNGLTASSVSGIDAATVDITTNEMLDGHGYILSVSTAGTPAGPTDLSANAIVSGGNTAAFTGVGVKPQVSSATAQDSTTVRVVFNEAMTDNAALTTLGSYAFTGGLTPVAATRIDSATVDVTTTEMLQGGSYTLTVSAAGPTDLAGNTVDGAANTAVFSGIGTKPQVASASVLNDTTVRIAFNEAMTNNAALITAASYTFTGGAQALTSIAVARVDATQVNVTVSGMLDGASYTASVSSSGPTDLVGNTVDPAANTTPFSGVRTGAGKTYYVDGSNPVAGDGTIGNPFKTLAGAVAATLPGHNDTIVVKPGTYSEQIALNRNTTLVGEQGSYHTLITGGGTSANLLTLAEACTVRGFTIGDAGASSAVYVPSNVSVAVSNCVVHTSGFGLRVDADSIAELINNTIYLNTVGVRGEAGAIFDPLKNSIFESNGTAISADPGAIVGGSYNAFFGNTTDFAGPSAAASDLFADPLFVDAATLNFHLKLASPCRDAGDPSAAYNDVDASRNDIGADGGPYGVEDTLAPSAVASASPTSGGPPLMVNFDGTGSSDEWGIATYSWDLDDSDGIQSDLTGATPSFNYTVEGGYVVTLTVTDNSGKTAQTTVPSAILVGGGLPIAVGSATPLAGPLPVTIQLTGIGGDPTDSGPVTYAWDLDGDGTPDTAEQNPQVTLPVGSRLGSHSFTLTVTNSVSVSRTAKAYFTATEETVDHAELVQPATGATVVVTESGAPTEGVTVSIPAGAMSSPAVIAVGAILSPPALKPTTYGPIVHLGPSGLQFSQAVTVALPHPTATSHPATLGVVYYNPTTNRWKNTGISGVTHLPGSPNDTVSFDTTHFTIFAVAAPLKKGDVNLDGAINAIDVQLVINGALGINVSPVNVDIDENGMINAVDVQLVINAALGLPI